MNQEKSFVCSIVNLEMSFVCSIMNQDMSLSIPLWA